jgi:hypothetical protein
MTRRNSHREREPPFGVVVSGRAVIYLGGHIRRYGAWAVQLYPGQMRRPRPVSHAVISLALWPLIIIFSPVIVLAGELVNRYVMRRVHRSAPAAQIAVVRRGGPSARAAAVRLLSQRTSLLLAVISNPLWIALTAPGRWVSDRFRRYPREPADR